MTEYSKSKQFFVDEYCAEIALLFIDAVLDAGASNRQRVYSVFQTLLLRFDLVFVK